MNFNPPLPLEDALDALIDYRGKTPKKTSFGIPLVTAKIVKDGRILPPTEFIHPKDFDSWMVRGLPNVGDVVLTTEAPLGEVAQIERLPIALAQRIVTLRGKPGVLDNNYLKYWLQSPQAQEILKGHSSGSTVVGIKQSVLRKIPIALPEYKYQKRIGEILSSLDELHGLFLSENDVLESIAQTFFKSWFVNFDPVHAKAAGREPEGLSAELAALFPNEFEESELGLIPRGWKLKRLSDLLTLHYGKSLSSSSRLSGAIRVYGSGGITGYHNAPLTTSKTVIVGRKGTVGSLFYEAAPCYPIDTVFYVTPKIGSVEFSYLLLRTLGLENMNTDAAVPGLNRENAYRLNVVEANDSVVQKFCSLIEPVFSLVTENIQQIELLQNIRNELLPRLISGKIRIEEAEEVLGSILPSKKTQVA